MSSPAPTLTPTTGALAVTALRDPDPDERRLERRAGGREVGPLHEPALQRLLGLAAGFLGPLEGDLGRHVGGLGHDDDLVRQDLEKAADDRERFLVAARPEAQLAGPEGRDQRRMV